MLDYLNKYLNFAESPRQSDELEEYRGEVTGHTVAAVGIPVTIFLKNVYESLGVKARDSVITGNLPRIAQLIADEDVIWIAYPIYDTRGMTYLEDHSTAIKEGLNHQQIGNLWHVLTDFGGGGVDGWIADILDRLLNAQRESVDFPDVRLIPAVRQIGPKSQKCEGFSSQGLIDRLAEIQSPDHNMRHER